MVRRAGNRLLDMVIIERSVMSLSLLSLAIVSSRLISWGGGHIYYRRRVGIVLPLSPPHQFLPLYCFHYQVIVVISYEK